LEFRAPGGRGGFGLGGEAHLADFVEEEDAAGGQLDLPGLACALVKAPRS